MNLHPWDLWTNEGKPQPWTEEIVSTLEEILRLRHDHPGANHYYIHAVEASPHPEKALEAAGRLPGLVPGAAHIVHMPAHVFVRLGRYAEAAEANRRAIAVDSAYLAKSDPGGIYLMYVAHNHQFLGYVAAIQGRSAEAIAEAKATVALVPPELVEVMPDMADYALATDVWPLIRFERWEGVDRCAATCNGACVTSAARKASGKRSLLD